MSPEWKARLLVGTLVVLAAGGCRPLLLGEFLVNGDPTIDPEFALKPVGEEERPPKVAVLVSADPGLAPEAVGCERDLAREFERSLAASSAEFKVPIELVPARAVESYCQDNPDWAAGDKAAAGKHLGADYLIELRVNRMQLLMPKSVQFYQGDVTVTGAVYDLSRPGAEPAQLLQYVRQYPKGHPQESSSVPLAVFRQKFIAKICHDLTCKFMPHRFKDTVPVD